MAGRVIAGRYEVLHEIGRGGMGTVYAGREVAGGRPCAIKIIRDEASLGTDAMLRFQREAQAPRRIGHPGLVEVYDAFVDPDGRMVLVMELLDGVSLRALLRHGVPLDGAVAVLCGALEPLAAAHAAGFVHRDMKPDNVFVAEEPGGGRRVKILDFGIARDLGSGALTQTGVIVGSVRYISPEQAHSARLVEPAGDVFSVGVMLYEAAAGRLPFGGESALETLTKLAGGAYDPLDRVVAGLPRAFVDLVHECLAFEPSARPPDAGALRERLLAFAAPTLPVIGATEPAEGWASEIRSVAAPSPIPMQSARAGRRAKGTALVHMIKAVRVATRSGLTLPVSDEDREWLEQRVLVSSWYPFDRFEWLIHLVHQHLMGGTDGGAIRMGELAAEHMLTGVHAGFVHEGEVERSLHSLINAWTRYFDFGEVTVETPRPGEATVTLSGYANMSRVHELMLIGWTLSMVRLAKGEVTFHEVLRAPSRGDDTLVVRLEYREP